MKVVVCLRLRAGPGTLTGETVDKSLNTTAHTSWEEFGTLAAASCSIAGAESRMIEKFDADGRLILFFKDPITGHCPWNEDCSCEQCVEENFAQELEGGYHTMYNPHKKGKKKKKNSIHSQLYKRWMNGDPTVGPLGEDNAKFVFLVDYGPKEKEESPGLVPQRLPPSDSSSPPSDRKEKTSSAALL
ncbi:hypothetical protein V6N11_059207 [Hibiscus sabdariffa]|uniref:Uncharacterized protein n=1 Tax=Hibiscus sabdariffa TaxID=183260 RepID=A0ABR2U786_9ROSI